MSDQRIIQGEPISPQNKALYDAGKKLLSDSLTTGRAFCKTMMEFSIGAIPIYLGILTFLFPKEYTLTVYGTILISIPAILFLISSLIFAYGLLPRTENISLDLIDDFRGKYKGMIQKRKKVICWGMTLFTIGVVLSISIIVMHVGA